MKTNTESYQNADLRNRTSNNKLFTYKIRMAVPETTSATSLKGYWTIIINFRDKLCSQLRTQNRKFRSGGSGEGYDNIRGKFIESNIIAYTAKDNIITQKIIWIEQ